MAWPFWTGVGGGGLFCKNEAVQIALIPLKPSCLVSSVAMSLAILDSLPGVYKFLGKFNTRKISFPSKHDFSHFCLIYKEHSQFLTLYMHHIDSNPSELANNKYSLFLVARFFVLPPATFSMVVLMEIKNVRSFTLFASSPMQCVCVCMCSDFNYSCSLTCVVCRRPRNSLRNVLHA